MKAQLSIAVKRLALGIFLYGAYYIPVALTGTGACLLDDSKLLINSGKNLATIAQEELLASSCKDYRREFKHRKKHHPQLSDSEFNQLTVLCGKWMFLNLGMKTNIGIPEKILNVFKTWPGIGKHFQGFGFFTDQSWAQKANPFGMVESKHQPIISAKKIVTPKIVQLSCAACHTGQLPNGDFAIGGSNEQFNYGKFNLYTLYSIWLIDQKKLDPARWAQEVIALYSQWSADKANRNKFFNSLIKLSQLPGNNLIIKKIIGEEPPPLKTQLAFLRSVPGLYNGFSPSLNFSNAELYISIPTLWDVNEKSDLHFGTLSNHGNLEKFVQEAFVYTNRSTKYHREMYQRPIIEFINCLKSPLDEDHKRQHNEQHWQAGAQEFKRSCQSCHNLDNGSGSKLITDQESFDYLNIPKDYIKPFNQYQTPDLQSKKTYNLLSKLDLPNSYRGLKTRRLTGLWSRSKLTLNGSGGNLAELFCLNQEIVKPETMKDRVHRDLCLDYTLEQRRGLQEYVRYFNQ